MKLEPLQILECPYCGGGLKLESGRFTEMANGEVSTGILLCECCADPIVAGIPYMRTGAAANRAKWDDQLMSLAAHHVLLDLPARYV